MLFNTTLYISILVYVAYWSNTFHGKVSKMFSSSKYTNNIYFSGTIFQHNFFFTSTHPPNFTPEMKFRNFTIQLIFGFVVVLLKILKKIFFFVCTHTKTRFSQYFRAVVTLFFFLCFSPVFHVLFTFHLIPVFVVLLISTN